MKFETSTTKNSCVFHLAEDEYIAGNVLFSMGGRLLTLNLTSQEATVIVGTGRDITTYPYREGYGSNARFSIITSFVQLSKSKVVVVDSLNNVFRAVDRDTNSTSLLAGLQGSSLSEVRDGTFKTSRFYSLRSVESRNGNVVYATQTLLGNIRVLNFSTRFGVVTHFSVHQAKPFGLAFDKSKEFLYISTNTGILRYNPANQNVIRVGHVIEKQRQEVSSYRSAPTAERMQTIVSLISKRFLTLNDANSQQEIINLYRKITSICTSNMARNSCHGDIVRCDASLAFDALQWNDTTIFIPCQRSLAVLSGEYSISYKCRKSFTSNSKLDVFYGVVNTARRQLGITTLNLIFIRKAVTMHCNLA